MIRVIKDKRGLAYPVSFLILFIGLMLSTTLVYVVATSRISVASSNLDYTAAENKMFSFHKKAESIMFSPNASAVVFFDRYGGKFVTGPTAHGQKINFTVGSTNELIFSSATGNVTYLVPNSNPRHSKFYLAGDNRLAVNNTSTTSGQLYAIKDTRGSRIVLEYRPIATSSKAGTSGGLPLNIVRIYLPNLNTTASITLEGEFFLRLTSSVVVTSRTYNLSTNPTKATVTVTVDGKTESVDVPITGSGSGTVIKVETVVNYITVARAGLS